MLVKRIGRLVLLGMLCYVSALFPETVSVLGDYTSPGDHSGDLIVTGGSINISTAGDLIVRGDVKVTGGSIFMGPSSGKLRVFGNLIVTNTLPSGDASIITHDDIEVTGAIITRSLLGDANITNTGASGSETISAESILTDGYSDSNVYSRDDLAVVGQIGTKSETGEAYIKSLNGDLYACFVRTNGYGASYVSANINLIVTGFLEAKSSNSSAYVDSVTGNLSAGGIKTNGSANSYVISGGFANVRGEIRTNSSAGNAHVQAAGYISSGSISTDGATQANVNASTYIEVRGDITTGCSGGRADVSNGASSITAVNITTNGSSHAYIDVVGDLMVRHNIRTYSSGADAYVQISAGDLKAYSIKTETLSGSAFVRTFGSGGLNVKGKIKTKSSSGAARVSVVGDIFAEVIKTEGVTDGYVVSTGGAISVHDFISTKATSGTAYVSAVNDISAISIKTDGDGHSYVTSTGGDITTKSDIRTNSTSGHGYVKAPTGNITARSIRIIAATDDNIEAVAGSGDYQFFPNETDLAQTIKDSEIFFDTDRTWHTLLSLSGSCTINGNGHRLDLESGAGIYLNPGASVLIKNIILDDVSGTMIRCEDNTSTLSLSDVTWRQIGDVTWANGSLQFFNDCLFEGGHQFLYSSASTSTIHKNSSLILSDDLTFKYSSAGAANRLSMIDETSILRFNNGTVHATEDLLLTDGTLVFERGSVLRAETGKSITFGTGNAADDLTLDFQLRSRFSSFGSLVNNNSV